MKKSELQVKEYDFLNKDNKQILESKFSHPVIKDFYVKNLKNKNVVPGTLF